MRLCFAFDLDSLSFAWAILDISNSEQEQTHKCACVAYRLFLTTCFF